MRGVLEGWLLPENQEVKKDSVRFPTEFHLDFQECWISNLESTGSCPTTPLPLTVSNVPGFIN